MRPSTVCRRDLLLGSSWAAAFGLTPGRVPGATTEDSILIKAKRKPPDQWNTYPSRTVRQLHGFIPDSATIGRSRYGGWQGWKLEAAGFFRTWRQGDRWWLVDPEGYPYINAGVGEVSPGRSPRSKAALKEKFGTAERWAEETTRLLAENGFNSMGGSTASELRLAQQRLPYTMLYGFKSSFPPARQPRMPVEIDTNFCIPVFHPDFEPHCDERAKALATFKNDPYLIGYFSDNEMSAPGELLDMSLTLDPRNPDTAPGYKAARAWLTRRKGSKAGFPDITDQDRDAFRGYVFERYFEVTTRAIRKYDPNHLCLGSRLHAMTSPDPRFWGPFRSPAIWRAAGKYLDVIAVNIYWQWSPDRDMLAMWHRESHKPILVSEFYAKGDDAGFPNQSGSGWIVPTQADRAFFYQNFTLGLLESRTCVGWNWFKYQDNDPEDPSADITNRDSNRGIVSIGYEPYNAALEGMRQLNGQVYAAIQYSDKRRS
jgi:hypothetical protein